MKEKLLKAIWEFEGRRGYESSGIIMNPKTHRELVMECQRDNDMDTMHPYDNYMKFRGIKTYRSYDVIEESLDKYILF